MSLNADQIKSMYGDEYPAFAVVNGNRISLWLETQFSRHYSSSDPNKPCAAHVSRYMDGSASMTLEQLQREWLIWTGHERQDFCQSAVWLYKQADYSDLLRFIAGRGDRGQWVSSISVLIGTSLPSGEAFPFLVRALEAQDEGRCANILQGIALTKHPGAKAVFQRHLQVVWNKPSLWNDDSFYNWVASEAELCIEYLIELGASPRDFEDQVRRLSEHVCKKNREHCRRTFSKYYPWLK
jgi:hypothetical protein